VNNRVAVVGAGLIGRSWAIVFAAGGFEVALYDAGCDVVDAARVLVGQGLRDLAQHGLLDDPQAAAARVRAAAGLADALDGAALVQEICRSASRTSARSFPSSTGSPRPRRSSPRPPRRSWRACLRKI
jgi:2-polyprenyl-6-methoxyphenol hydroxylase-like FAD-dependent oxidoreductase